MTTINPTLGLILKFCMRLMLMVEKTFDSYAKVQDHKNTIDNHTDPDSASNGIAVDCCGQAQPLSSPWLPCSDF